MRPIILALIALAASASPASAAVITFDDRSSPEDISLAVDVLSGALGRLAERTD